MIQPSFGVAYQPQSPALNVMPTDAVEAAAGALAEVALRVEVQEVLTVLGLSLIHISEPTRPY